MREDQRWFRDQQFCSEDSVSEYQVMVLVSLCYSQESYHVVDDTVIG
jgi:hypothetical protein